MLNSIRLAMLVVGVVVCSAANAANYEKAIAACKDAAASSQGVSAVSKLKKIKSRGGGYQLWFNIAGLDEPMRSFCHYKRGQVERFVVDAGRWTSTNPRPPAAS